MSFLLSSSQLNRGKDQLNKIRAKGGTWHMPCHGLLERGRKSSCSPVEYLWNYDSL